MQFSPLWETIPSDVASGLLQFPDQCHSSRFLIAQPVSAGSTCRRRHRQFLSFIKNKRRLNIAFVSCNFKPITAEHILYDHIQYLGKMAVKDTGPYHEEESNCFIALERLGGPLDEVVTISANKSNIAMARYNISVPNKNLRPLVKPDDQTKF